MTIDWTATAVFIGVIVLLLAALGIATLIVAAWALITAGREERQAARQMQSRARLVEVLDAHSGRKQ